jgi:predicted nucleic acid-binding protein
VLIRPAIQTISAMKMVDRVVVDASVAIAYLQDEVGTPAARAAFASWAASAAELLVPAHFWIEVTHVLLARRRLPPDELTANLVDVDGLGIRTIETDRPLLLLAIDRMVRARLSAYDAVYLALAMATDSRLATLDRQLAAAAGDAGMLIGPSGISEPRPDYQPDDDSYAGWTHTAVVGAHIAELRRRSQAET